MTRSLMLIPFFWHEGVQGYKLRGVLCADGGSSIRLGEKRPHFLNGYSDPSLLSDARRVKERFQLESYLFIYSNTDPGARYCTRKKS